MKCMDNRKAAQCPGGVFTAYTNNYKIHSVKPRHRKELLIFCICSLYFIGDAFFQKKVQKCFLS
jgi:hypothetical protein